MKHVPMVPIFVLCVALILPSCASFPLMASPAPRCIGNSWSYAENVQTKIEIGPDLEITLQRFPGPWEVVVVEDGSGTPCARIDQVTIYGDGRVVYDYSGGTGEKQIQKDQLQRIVTAFEEANFYAISPGCRGGIYGVTDSAILHISIKTDGEIHEISDHGLCDTSDGYFDRYCDLGGQIESILRLPCLR